MSSAKGSGEEPTVPEDLGKKAAISLLQEIYRVLTFKLILLKIVYLLIRDKLIGNNKLFL